MRILVRKECWTLTWPAKLVLCASLAIALWGGTRTVYPFLAETHKVPADVLVVEGWVHDYAIRAAVDEFTAGRYRSIIATGGPGEGSSSYTNDYNTTASVGVMHLRKAGIPADRSAMAPARFVLRDRTYASAVGLREWLQVHASDVRRINVITADAHARRTRLLFQLALGRGFEVGVIAVPSPDYDARRWWRSSEGVRTVIGEMLSYTYAKLFFAPPALPANEPILPN